MNGNPLNEKVKSNVALGIVGALLGAVLGAVLWVVLYQIGIIAAIAGYAIAFCAFKGYVILGKAMDKKAAVISLIVSLVVVTLANFLCWSYDVYGILSAEYDVTFWDSMSVTLQVATEPENIVSFLRDLGIGYVLMIVSFVTNLRTVQKRENEETNSGEEA